jgi:hypothetical protein
MSPDEEAQSSHARAAKLALIGVFLGSVATFSRTADRGDGHAVGSPFEPVLLGFASYRIGRMLAYERVAAPLRASVTTTEPDPAAMARRS